MAFGPLPPLIRAGPALLCFPKRLCGPPLCRARLVHSVPTKGSAPSTRARPAAVSLPRPPLWPHLPQDGARWPVLPGPVLTRGVGLLPGAPAQTTREPNPTIPRVYHHLCPEMLPGGRGNTYVHCAVGRFL